MSIRDFIADDVAYQLRQKAAAQEAVALACVLQTAPEHRHRLHWVEYGPLDDRHWGLASHTDAGLGLVGQPTEDDLAPFLAAIDDAITDLAFDAGLPVGIAAPIETTATEDLHPRT